MKVKCFNDTDTLYIEFRNEDIVESRGVEPPCEYLQAHTP
jgi:uncharacterized protein YuzE